MRLWSLHPSYLDPQGLVALWREALLAQKVLKGQTKGYKHHPQLIRFKEQADPLSAIGYYLKEIHQEAVRRSYSFDESKIVSFKASIPKIKITSGQLEYEMTHLRAKLSKRNPERLKKVAQLKTFQLHPLFKRIPGPVADWEK